MNKFIEDLASSRPTPGGGAAAAVAGAMAAALVEMVCGLTPQCSALSAQCTKLRKRLMELADKDCRAFEAVMAAYKNKTGKEEALKKAMEVPEETMRVAKQVEELAQELVEKGNKNAISDAKSAVYLAQAAQKSAMENVEINKQALVKLGGGVV